MFFLLRAKPLIRPFLLAPYALGKSVYQARSTRFNTEPEVSAAGEPLLCSADHHPEGNVSPWHQRMPFLIPPDRYADWLGAAWREVLSHPDKSPLAKNSAAAGVVLRVAVRSDFNAV